MVLLGPVFRTYEPTRDRLVAVKVFRLDIVPEQAQALAEALSRAAHASLFHPSIVEPIEAGVQGTLAYRAEEYVAAESLDVAMRHYAPAPIEKVLPFITQLAGAIDFARAAGVGHGGLHPRDIFVTPDEARATGFGVVDALEQVGIRAPIRRPYSAPERIAGAAWGTPADVFALAAITYELLTSRRPAGTGTEIGAPPDGERGEDLLGVLARAMDDAPEARYAGALAFAAALEAAARGADPDSAAAVAAFPAEASAGPHDRAHAMIGEPPEPDADIMAPPTASSSVEEPDLPIGDVASALGVSPGSLQSHDTLGEFRVEAALDPVHEALDNAAVERAAETATPMLFDDDDEDEEIDEENEEENDDDSREPEGPLTAAAGAGERFAEDFEADVDDELHPVDRSTSTYAEKRMFGTSESDRDLLDPHDSARPAVLPVAVGVVIGLLLGFAGGYFVASRDSVPVESETAGAPTSPGPGPTTPSMTGAATPNQPGQYSEQKVAPPAVPPPAAGAATRPSPPPAVAESSAPAPRSGRLVVRSTPSRAGVTINGKWRGRTPLTLENLPFGAYTVRIVQPGYQVAREEFTLSASAASRTLEPRLERAEAPAPPPSPASAPPATGPGILYVDSLPRGATVVLDGKAVGTTPLNLPDVRPGDHTVRLEMTGKRTWASTTTVVSGQTARVTGSLEDIR